MNSKKAKALRREVRTALGTGTDDEVLYQRGDRSGSIRLHPGSPRAVYRKAKKIMMESSDGV